MNPNSRQVRQPNDSRLIGVDLLRAVAIAVVLGRHWLGAGLTGDQYLTIDTIAIEIFRHGMWGVTLFFVISGFLITRSTMAREPDFFALSFRQFYKRRAGRILPLLATSIVIGTIGLAFGADGGLYDYVFHDPNATFGAGFWLSLFTFTFNWARLAFIAQSSGWGLHWDVLWYLAVEEQFYVLFPLLVIWTHSSARLMRALAAAVAIAIIGRGMVGLSGIDGAYALISSFACIDALAIGVLSALLSNQYRFGARQSLMIASTGAAIAVSAYFSTDLVITPTILAIGAGSIIFGVQRPHAFSAKFWLPFARIGELSYGIYLLHPLVLYVIAPLLRGSNFVGGYLLFVIATAALAELSYRYLERPANRWIRGMGNRPGPLPAPQRSGV